MSKRDITDWFDAWSVIPWGIGGDSQALRCPKANGERPEKTPDCYIELDGQKTNGELRKLAAKHRRTAHRH